MALTIKEQSEKTYKVGKIGNWNVNLNYESINGAAPKQVNVDAGKDGNTSHFFNLTYVKNGGNNFNFNGGAEIDLPLVTEVLAEIEIIYDSFNPPAS